MLLFFSGLIPAATVTLLHVRTAPTPVGKVVTLLHVRDTATTPIGAGALHGRKWSPEAKHGQACCQKGRLDGRTESDPSEQKTTMRSHGAFLHFQIDFIGFVSGAAPPKTAPEAETRRPGRHTGRVEDCQASGPWQHPSGCGRPAGQR